MEIIGDYFDSFFLGWHGSYLEGWDERCFGRISRNLGDFMGLLGLVSSSSLFLYLLTILVKVLDGVLHLVGTIIFGAMIPASYFAEKWIFGD